jgi:formylglycine-generating enzyme
MDDQTSGAGSPTVAAGAAEIFISYSRGDRAHVGVLARLLQEKGFRVWWDPDIPPGEKFDRVIMRALASCKIVLVAWSHNSVDSDWVLNEADEGRRRKILLPVLLDAVDIPLGFRRVQACDLRSWNGDPNDVELQRLMFRIAKMLGHAPPDDGPPPDGPARWPKSVAAGLLALLFTIMGYAAWQANLSRTFDTLITAAEDKISGGDFTGAEAPITEAAGLRPNDPALRALRTRLALARARTGGSEKTPPTDGSRDCADCPELVAIPAGEFIMGAEPGEEFYDPAQGPKHKVSIPRPFLMGRYEVTVREYGAFVRDSGYKPQGTDCLHYDFTTHTWLAGAGASWREPPIFPQQSQHPVVCVSWNDAQSYVAWLTGKTGKRYRLPSEAEWEYAARAGAAGPWLWGTKPEEACRHANVADEAARARLDPDWIYRDCSDGMVFTAPVGRFQPNAFGLFDVIGNVWEWVEDCFVSTYERAPVDGSARVTAGCEQRVIRGGGWLSRPSDTRLATRGFNKAQNRIYAVGFRIARDE